MKTTIDKILTDTERAEQHCLDTGWDEAQAVRHITSPVEPNVTAVLVRYPAMQTLRAVLFSNGNVVDDMDPDAFRNLHNSHLPPADRWASQRIS